MLLQPPAQDTVTHTHTHAHTSTDNHVLQRFDHSFESLFTQNTGEIIGFGKCLLSKKKRTEESKLGNYYNHAHFLSCS